MSFDLYFYKSNQSKLSKDDIAEYLTRNIPYNISSSKDQWFYQNEETDVYFSIDYNEPNTEDEDIEMFDKFEGFTNLNFSFNINYVRPRFFGLEVFPIIDKFIADLNLFVFDPQEGNLPNKYTIGFLQNMWIKHNDLATDRSFEELDLNYFPLEKSNYMWSFQFNRVALQNSLTEDIFVPGYFVLKNKQDGLLYTACVWPNHIPIILPPVDYIIIDKEAKKLFGTVKSNGLISYKDVMSRMGDYFEEFEYKISGLKKLSPDNANKLERQYDSLSIYMTLEQFGNGVTLSGFVNIEKPNNS